MKPENLNSPKEELTPFLIDTHCHLVSPALRGNFSSLLERAREAGIQKIINIAYDPETVDILLTQLAASPLLAGTVGIQPHDALKFHTAEGERIHAIAATHPGIVGIGEIGLDAHYNLAPMEKQIECFEYFLEVALAERLPVVVHTRDTHGEIIRILRSFTRRGLEGVIHCFTGTLDEARDFLSCGFYLSFSGIVTFKNATALREVAHFVPTDRMLIETDSPYLAPVPLRGKVNEPANLIHTCRYLAEIHGLNTNELAHLTSTNALRIFRKLSG